jgi:hypothetical protein
MPNGFGRRFGRGYGRGMGFGFRGSSPPWPYIGRGRGGLPRCGYFMGGDPAYWPHEPQYYGPPAAQGYMPYGSQMNREDELNYLKGQAEVIKQELDQIESRMKDLEVEKEE